MYEDGIKKRRKKQTFCLHLLYSCDIIQIRTEWRRISFNLHNPPLVLSFFDRANTNLKNTF